MINGMSTKAHGYTSGGPLNLRPHLVVKLKRGWLFDSVRRVFLSETGIKFSAKADLPGRSRIVYISPDLANQSQEKLLKDERNLSRYLQIIFPKGTNPKEYLDVIGHWKCVERVRLPPEISLP